MLEVRALTKRYSGSPAVDQVSFTALPGEVTGYLGPNGSGKSTTVKMITGLRNSLSRAAHPRPRGRIQAHSRIRARGAVPLPPPDRRRVPGTGRRVARPARCHASRQNRRAAGVVVAGRRPPRPHLLL